MNEEEYTKLGYYLHHAFTALVGELDRALREAGLPLNHAQFSIIQTLARSRDGVMSQRDIAAELGKDPAAVSRGLNYLEARGLVERHAVSGCKNGVSLTPRAAALRPEIERVICHTVSKACAGVSVSDYSAAVGFLQAVYSNLRH